MRERRGSEPSSSPRTKTAAKLRVRARSRSSTATRPASPAAPSRTSACSSAATTSSRSTLAADRAPAVELLEHPQRRVVGAQVEPRGLAGRRSLGAVREANHRADAARGPAATGGSPRAQLGERRQRRLAQLLGLLLDALRARDRPAAQPALDEVDRGAAEARVRRAQVREQLAPSRVEPRVAQQLEQRVAERRRAEPRAVLDRVRDPQAAEHRLERRAPGLERRRDERDLGRIDAAPSGGPAPPRRRARGCRGDPRPRGTRPRRRAPAPAPGSPRRARARDARAPGARTRATAARAPRSGRRRAPTRSSAVRRSDAKTSRPGSYGSETCTSARPESASSSDHSAPVRSSKPYAKTGSPCHAPRSASSRSAARRRWPSRSQSPTRSSSAR